MTVREILIAMLRHWYIPLLLLTGTGLLTVMLAQDGGIYTTRTVVSFMLPAATSLQPSNGIRDTSIIAFAGTVAQEINNGRPPARYSTDDAPFYGAGVREGVIVGLPNAGNQWMPYYPRAEIDIQIVGRTREWVEAKQTELVDRVLEVAETQQSAVAAPGSRITAAVVPLTLNIEHIAATRSGTVSAGVAMLAAALIVSGWLCVTVERWRSARRTRRRAPAGRPSSRLLEGQTT
ncbi:hypothetical protein [Agromyces badenianii]|uniref:hypothetical protein n=1 Tax=Agromyces badenianii TaxID=2080742 RepID=UPI000D59D5EF|nr:hypothetical protein [Agromyces badenianii]PWC05161.1 hypothetical protein DCE94_02320 [Agromyces badenianii]